MRNFIFSMCFGFWLKMSNLRTLAYIYLIRFTLVRYMLSSNEKLQRRTCIVVCLISTKQYFIYQVKLRARVPRSTRNIRVPIKDAIIMLVYVPTLYALGEVTDNFLQRGIFIVAGGWDTRPDIGDMGARHILGAFALGPRYT